ncbi:MAG TPA: class I SAM-dependent RNA methyltransferase, partial [Kiritimatiellia bacterium]|nr:class I SAM-dependent RNA methyltransferase [Kiritimatiellia bacterium]
VDSSGAPLHRRGYRLAVAKAPLREHLAAALIMASGWPGSVPLVDPFCGSGTLMIEAAMMAAGMPPGLRRRFAFEAWAGYPEALAVARSRLPTDRPSPPPMFGFDRDAGAIKAARANAERAGVEGLIEWRAQSISDLALPEGTPGWMVTNPPYGERVTGGRDLRDLYARLGSVWRTRAASWHKFYVCSSPRWSGQLGMTSKPVVSFSNGGLPVTLMEAYESKEQS